MLPYSFSQEDKEIPATEERLNMDKNIQNNNNNKKNENNDKVDAGMPLYDRTTTDHQLTSYESEKSTNHANNYPHGVPNAVSKMDPDVTEKENKYSPFSSIPKSTGRQDKKDESETDTPRAERFLAEVDRPRVDSGQVKKALTVEHSNAPVANNVVRNAPHIPLTQDELEKSEITMHKRPLADISPSVNRFDKKKKKPRFVEGGHSENPPEIAAAASSKTIPVSPEKNMKGGTRPETFESSPSGKQESRPLTKNNNNATVTISIGRIEIKAISSQVQQPPSIAQKRAPGLSLQDYIKLRDDGQL